MALAAAGCIRDQEQGLKANPEVIIDDEPPLEPDCTIYARHPLVDVRWTLNMTAPDLARAAPDVTQAYEIAARMPDGGRQFGGDCSVLGDDMKSLAALFDAEPGAELSPIRPHGGSLYYVFAVAFEEGQDTIMFRQEDRVAQGCMTC